MADPSQNRKWMQPIGQSYRKWIYRGSGKLSGAYCWTFEWTSSVFCTFTRTVFIYVGSPHLLTSTKWLTMFTWSLFVWSCVLLAFLSVIPSAVHLQIRLVEDCKTNRYRHRDPFVLVYVLFSSVEDTFTHFILYTSAARAGKMRHIEKEGRKVRRYLVQLLSCCLLGRWRTHMNTLAALWKPHHFSHMEYKLKKTH